MVAARPTAATAAAMLHLVRDRVIASVLGAA
jgi:hypothetical protein